jgi:predicted AAA+ superfamily ATPase
MLKRYLQEAVVEDLKEKMVFVAGPRQVGKTTLAKQILDAAGVGEYLSWDRRQDRKKILEARWPGGDALVVLDELHKYRFWKRWLKGEFDTHREHLRFLVTGSARLDVYRKGGDSLQGRYHHYRLHPLSYAEVEGTPRGKLPSPGEPLSIPSWGSAGTMESLMRFGGFPEPFLAQSERTLRRWQKERVDRFFREDVRDLEAIRDMSSMQLLADMLADKVASLLSINSLREDLEVSHRAVSHWMDVLERLYYIFRIRPYSSRSFKGLRKMPKAYLWDTSLVTDEGARFENLVALHLLKFCHYLEDHQGYRTELLYLRDTVGREVDFLVTCQRKPWFLVEAKVGEEKIENSIRAFRDQLKVPFAYQVVLRGTGDFVREDIRCLPAHQFLAALL